MIDHIYSAQLSFVFDRIQEIIYIMLILYLNHCHKCINKSIKIFQIYAMK